MAPRAVLALLLLLAATSGCSSFSTVRSAEVHPGPSVNVQGTVSTPPGEGPAWFWSLDCASECDRPIAGAEVAVAIGQTDGTPFSVGAGVSGLLHPFLEGYLQLAGGDRPWGVGARLGIPATGWTQHQLYGRYDVPLGRGSRLLLNPGLFYHGGNSPNGENPGHFLALVQGVGLLLPGEHLSLVPSLAVGAGRGERESYGRQIGPFSSVFGVASVGVVLHRSREARPGS